MPVFVQFLQPRSRHRLLTPGVTGLHLPLMFERAGIEMKGPAEEGRTAALLRYARLAIEPPEECFVTEHFLNDVRCLWIDGGNAHGIDDGFVADELAMPVLHGGGGMYAGEEGGLAMLEELECHGMVCDLGQTMLKVSWADRRWAFRRDLSLLPLYDGTGVHSVPEKGAQRRVLRRFIGESLGTALAEADAGLPEGVVFALPSVLDKWGQPAGSSYIGMNMDTQLVTDALELAGLPDMRHWLLNDAELAATSAVFDERVIRSGKALVFTLGTAVGCALADPMAAALHYAETSFASGHHS